ncbi:MAG TPA: formylglycine-generating enzyme family protein [Candidatus Brocadiia bacterium]|nr:formylglycine-generating enzyme family protein [Candidatus Brocadiia bacterium]
MILCLAVSVSAQEETRGLAVSPPPEWAKSLVSKEQLAAAETYGIPVAFENSIGMRFVLIPPGEFMMGGKLSPEETDRRWPGGKLEWYQWEQPRHKVKITKPFYLSIQETTKGEFAKFVSEKGYKTDAEKAGKAYAFVKQSDGSWKYEERSGTSWKDPNFSQEDQHPVVCASWNDAKAFCDWLTEKTGRDIPGVGAGLKPAPTYGLPTEAQWEYASLAGGSGIWWWGDNEENAQGNANIASSGEEINWTNPFKGVRDGHTFTAPVGSFKPNAWGLYDVIGNVWEWCEDWFDEGYYSRSPSEDPPGPSSGQYRVIRGGSWLNFPRNARSSYRFRNTPTLAVTLNGFRVMVVVR